MFLVLLCVRPEDLVVFEGLTIHQTASYRFPDISPYAPPPHPGVKQLYYCTAPAGSLRLGHWGLVSLSSIPQSHPSSIHTVVANPKASLSHGSRTCVPPWCIERHSSPP